MTIDPAGNVGDDGRGFGLGAGEVADQYRKGIAAAIPQTEIADVVMCHQFSGFVTIAAAGLVGEQHDSGAIDNTSETILSCPVVTVDRY